MPLNSAEFFVIFFSFLPIFFLFKKHKWIILLLFNYYFYLNFIPKFVPLLFLTSIASYISALIIEKIRDVKLKKIILFFSIAGALIPLLYLKYYNFIGDILLPDFTLKKLIIPIGISFYTMQIISYMIDVYRGKYKAYTHLGHYLCYVSFFGTILSGPIERANNFIPQLSKKISFDEDRIFEGLKTISWGLFLKMVVADNLGVFVDKVYGIPSESTNISSILTPSQFPGIPLIIATVFYGVQLYADFNGYSHIALGYSKIIGLDIMENFKFPYFRQGVIDFWRGWHLSLSTWLRDYVYFPLGGSRKGKLCAFFNRLAVFLVSGLWHGASWNFIVWGGLHGVYQAVEGAFKKNSAKDSVSHSSKNSVNYSAKEGNSKINILKIIGTFILVDFAWIFFRAVDLKSAIYIVTHLFSNWSIDGVKIIFSMIVNKRIFLLDLLLITFTFIVDYYKYKNIKLSRKGEIIFYAALWLMIIFIAQRTSSSFIYFKF